MSGATSSEILAFTSEREEGFDYSKVKHLIGQASPLRDPHDEVSASDIRHWCEVMRDTNPLYTDEEYAKASKYGGIIAPPQMIQTWSLDPFQEALDRFVREDPPFKEDPHNQLFKLIDSLGYDGVVATYQSQEYLLPVRPGDTIRCKIGVGKVSQYDHYTRMGVGRYVEIVYTFVNQKDETVCVATFRVLKYRAPIATRRLYQG